MALEDLTGSDKFITALVPTNPLGADDRREGDDHLRGIKNVLHNTFPKLDGVVNKTAAEMNAGLDKGANAVQKTGDSMTGGLVLWNAAYTVVNAAYGAANYGYLAWGINAAESWISSDKQGTGVRLPLVVYAPSMVINAPLTVQANVRTTGSLTADTGATIGSAIELMPDGAGSCWIDFHQTTGEDFTYRIAMWGSSAGVLRVAYKDGIHSKLMIDGAQAGLANGANIDNCQAEGNAIAFGWRADGTLGLRVDNAQFGNTWPIGIGGKAAYAGRADSAAIADRVSSLENAGGGTFGPSTCNGNFYVSNGFLNVNNLQNTGGLWRWFWNGGAGDNHFYAFVNDTNIGWVAMNSDARIKHSIAPLGLDVAGFMALQPISYRYRDIGIYRDDGQDHWGFLAQNVERAMPKALVGSTTAVLESDPELPQPASVDDRVILAQAVLMIQNLQARVLELERMLQV